MSPRLKLNKRQRIVFFPFTFFLLPFLMLPVAAHQVQVDKQVGGTTHIEPNDNPRAGEQSLIWFALTHKGGELIPLQQCQCELAIYTKPNPKGASPLQKPALKAVSAEGYQGIPGANITFPQVGTYELVLNGKPTSAGNFQPFELKFTVTVVAGQSTRSSSQTTEKGTPTPHSWQVWAIPISGGLIVGLIWGVWRQLRGKRESEIGMNESTDEHR